MPAHLAAQIVDAVAQIGTGVVVGCAWWDTRNVESIGWAYSTISDGSITDSGPLGPGYSKEHPSTTCQP